MTAKKLLLFWILLLCQVIAAQQDSIVPLKEVVVSDAQLQRFSHSVSVQKLNDSIIEKNQASLTSLLHYNTVIYFKENGLGMVSSPSFRGTTAQQTAVIWNGININSQLTGQTDFNTISSNDFENITVRAGGGSALYGSSAIGGSVHLNNELQFKNQFQNTVLLNYGSFDTFGAHYKTSISNEKNSATISISRNSSDNDYEYLGMNGKKNENGQFYNTSMNVSFGSKINAFHFLKFYSQLFESERHFSGTLAAPSKSKYQDLNSRNLLEWAVVYHQVQSSLKVGFLSEKYTYFENFATNNYETSKAETFVAKYDLGYQINSKWEANVIIDFNQIKGIGSNIGANHRNIGSATFLMKYSFWKHLQTEWSVRKELTNAYQSPLLYALGINAPLTKHYGLKLNLSRNFRIPTFNDRYWQGLGNPDLKPESSYQAELGQVIKYRHFAFSVTGYFIDIQDLIQWIPSQMDGNFRPNNVARVKSYGLESIVNYNIKIGNHRFDFNSNYAYTVSEDAEKKEQLIYVPFHKCTAALAYSYKKWSANYQFLYNGNVTTPSRKYNTVEAYLVSNAGIDFDFGKINVFAIGFEVLNLWNEKYQSVLQRPMPGRNYRMNLTFKF